MKIINTRGCLWIMDCVHQATRENTQDIGLREAMAYAEDAEFQMSEGNPPCFEIKSWHTESGHTEEFEVPETFVQEA